MLNSALLIAHKDLRLVLSRGTGLAQALLLGLLLIFLLSLSHGPGDPVSPQTAATVFWLASAFCQVLIFTSLYGLEEAGSARHGLLLAPMPVQAIWLGKAMAGCALLLMAQFVFLPATIVFLGQALGAAWLTGLIGLVATDWGLVALGSLLGGLAQGQASRESLLTVVLFPLLAPTLLAGIKTAAMAWGGAANDAASWIGLAGAFGALFSGAGLILFPFAYSGEE